MISIAGGVVALIFASWASGLLLRLVANAGSSPLDIHLDSRVLFFTAMVSIFSGLIFGLAPARQSSTRDDLVSCLRESSAGQSRASSQTFGKMLIVTQIAFSMILLVAAALFLGTLYNLESWDVGYVHDGLLLAEVDFRMAGYRGNDVTQLPRRLLERLREATVAQQATVSENGLSVAPIP